MGYDGRAPDMVRNAPSRTMKQKILVLYLHNPDLNSRVVAWSLYDGTGAQPDVPEKDNRYGAPTGSAADPPPPAAPGAHTISGMCASSSYSAICILPQ